ncbi:unnamed protein product [Rangifer tarandus platyrhynchus]|uniref:Uncharacterized protein n=1 Tax=Rangifer tarandus platyrhynchus TaxID=3082113 RepID=A0ABN8XZX1_RANTA|nr:unnamed protein product [Rangifer tarandus platyrhynchus]
MFLPLLAHHLCMLTLQILARYSKFVKEAQKTPSMGTQDPMKWAFPATMVTPESTAGTPGPRCASLDELPGVPRPHAHFQERPMGLATASR